MVLKLHWKSLESVSKEPKTVASERAVATAISEEFPSGILDLLKILEERFSFRWERGNLNHDMSLPLIYWPVRLRPPGPIHAAQCFVAAGLQKLGCQISLWIDDLGRREYSNEQFVDSLKKWFNKVGGDGAALSINKFSDILENKEKRQYTDHMWEILDGHLKIPHLWPGQNPPA
ncbi:conserved hypothetical protein, partial [delta proteobacterium NaphS2]